MNDFWKLTTIALRKLESDLNGRDYESEVAANDCRASLDLIAEEIKSRQALVADLGQVMELARSVAP